MREKNTHAADNAAHLHQLLTAALVRKFTMAEAAASALAQAVACGLREVGGGDSIYIPAADKSERDAAIRRECTGTNLEELRIKWGLSQRQIYNILNGKRS